MEWGLRRRGRRRQPRLAPATVGLGLLVLSVSGFVTMVARGGPGEAAPLRAATQSERDATRFYRDVKGALDPLLTDARVLEALLAEVGAGSSPKPPVADLAKGWADHFALAGQRVAAVPPPAGAGTASVKPLYRMATSLYVEAAESVRRLVDVAEDAGRRAEALKMTRRIQVLGDRLFDAGTRMLRAHGTHGDEIELRRFGPAHVPDFVGGDPEAGLAPSGAPPVSSTPGGSKSAARRWARRHADDLKAAARFLGSTRDAPEVGATARSDIARQFADGAPAAGPALEGVNVIRLALLVSAESVRAAEAGSTPSWHAEQAAGDLREIARSLWDTGAQLLVAANAGPRSLYAVPEGRTR